MHQENFKRTIIICFLLCLSGLHALAQFNYFPYYTADSTGIKQLSDDCGNKVSASYILPQGVNSAYKKDYKEYQEASTEYVKKLIKRTGAADEIINPFLQSVYKRITDGNPHLKKYTVVLSNYPIMNAVYVGGNVVVFYAPLLSRMDNESQVAAILCHEFAHGELDHVQKGIKKTLDEIHSKEFKAEIKKLRKEEFNVNEKVNLLALKFAFNRSYHHRSLEKAADSLGYLFLKNTSYDAAAAVGTLENLKHCDEAPFNDSIDYPRFFKCSSSTFDFKKLKPYKSSSIFSISAEDLAKEDSLRDSLRTHPDCDKRIGFIQDLMKLQAAGKGSSTDSLLYKKVKWASAMEMIMGFYQYEYYDEALFNALLYLQHNPDNEFLKSLVSLSWDKLHLLMKNHELSDYISNNEEDNPPQFNKLIHLLNTIRLTEMSEFGICFYQNNKDAFKHPEYSLAVNYAYDKMVEDANVSSLKEKYKNQYSTGRFADLFELNTDPKKKKK